MNPQNNAKPDPSLGIGRMNLNRYTVHVPDLQDAVFASDFCNTAMSEAYRLATHQDPALKPTAAWVIDQSTGKRVYEWSQ